MKKLIGIIAATALAATIAAPAAAAPSNKGATTIEASGATADALAEKKPVLRPGSLVGTTKDERPIVKFGIVGNPGDGVIEHVGGIAVKAVGDSHLQLRNFWIDLEAAEVTGLVEGIGRAPLFNFGDNEEPKNCLADDQVELVFTEAASEVITGDKMAIKDAWAACATVEPKTPGRSR